MTALDRFVPEPRQVELDWVEIGAPIEVVYREARQFDWSRSALVRALFWLRTWPDRMGERQSAPPSLRFQDIVGEASGFRLLDEVPNARITVGAIGRFWEPSIPFAEVPAARFAAFATPGYGKVAWEMRFEPLGEASTQVTFELRTDATDDASWRSLRRYLRVIGPFSSFIRKHLLAMLVRELGTPEAVEQERPLPGDELIEAPKAQATHGITIEAPPEAVWPWLVQMGCGRAGWYSYDVLDNAGFPSAQEIVPELQSLSVGDQVPATPDGLQSFWVERLEPPRLLVFGSTTDLDTDAQLDPREPLPESYWRVTWAFVLEPSARAATRLIVRARLCFAPEQVRWRAALMTRVHPFMQTAQLRHLKSRVEGSGRGRPRQPAVTTSRGGEGRATKGD